MGSEIGDPLMNARALGNVLCAAGPRLAAQRLPLACGQGTPRRQVPGHELSRQPAFLSRTQRLKPRHHMRCDAPFRRTLEQRIGLRRRPRLATQERFDQLGPLMEQHRIDDGLSLFAELGIGQLGKVGFHGRPHNNLWVEILLETMCIARTRSTKWLRD